MGLGRMGANMVRRLMRDGHECVVYDINPRGVADLVAEGAIGAASLETSWQARQAARGLADAAGRDHRHGSSTNRRRDGAGRHHHRRRQFQLSRRGGPGRRARAHGIDYVDVGTSGGVWGLRARLLPDDRRHPEAAVSISIRSSRRWRRARRHARRRSPRNRAAGYLHCGPSGAGHFVKMVHNGIEYGMMAAYAEGLNILQGRQCRQRNARRRRRDERRCHEPQYYQFDIDLAAVAEVWRHGSVIGSWLLDLTAGRAEGRTRALADWRPGFGFRRGPLDAEGGDRHRRAGPGPVVRAVRPVRSQGNPNSPTSCCRPCASPSAGTRRRRGRDLAGELQSAIATNASGS